MPETLTTRGSRLDLEIVQGKTLQFDRQAFAVYAGADGAETRLPLDFSHGVLRGHLRHRIADAQPAATLIVLPLIAASGVYRVKLDASVTAALPGGLNRQTPASRYERWDVEYEDQYGQVVELVWGEAFVVREATR